MKEQTSEQKGFLTGKKVVVLGGSSGIGLATAVAASQEGAELIIVSSNQQRIDKALEHLPQGSKGLAINLTDEKQVQELFTKIGAFDHLVYTAGESLVLKNIEDVIVQEAKGFFDLRYWGAFTAVKYAASHINAGGSITLTGGVASARPGKGWSLGASICAAMEGFTRAMAIELAPLRVNLVSPGVIRTNLWSGMADADRGAMYETVANGLPLKRVGEAEDIAQTYIYLMRQQFSTGQIIIADGGYVLV
jgi:NAD(P)-dependent dehydrogenase (short-subunit alcohol dehydrogenase family)